MFKVPEKYRLTGNIAQATDSTYGNNGIFVIRLSNRSTAMTIASDGMGWEHVSVHIISDGKERLPSWSEMCKIKDMFWSEEDCIIQYHPARSEYVNNHKYTLHLWRPINMIIPKPDPSLVGIV